MTDPGPADRRALAAKVDNLFRTMHPSGRGPYSDDEVAAAIRARGGPTISGTYLWQLRKGLRDNPTRKHLTALAGFFGVPPAYFFDDDLGAATADDLALLAALRDEPMRRLARSASGLSPASLFRLAQIAEWFRELEGRADHAPPAPIRPVRGWEGDPAEPNREPPV